MYEELINTLRKMRDVSTGLSALLPKSGGDVVANLYGEAADAIEELSREIDIDNAAMTAMDAAVPRWIPVTERLPKCEKGTEVGNIEWINCGMVFAGCFGRGGKYRDAYFRTWTDATEGIDAKDADYWRPCQIPKPPKEEV